MKIVVIGGTGLIGSKTVERLRQHGHDVVAAAPNTGVNTITGEGLDAAMVGTDVVVDLANAPSWEEPAVLDFFETSGRNLFAAEKKAVVKYHVALSVVGVASFCAGFCTWSVGTVTVFCCVPTLTEPVSTSNAGV